MKVCICVSLVHICTGAYTYVAYVVHIHRYICTHCTYTYTHAHTCMHLTYVHTCTSACRQTPCVHTYMSTYVHALHAHLHEFKCMCTSGSYILYEHMHTAHFPGMCMAHMYSGAVSTLGLPYILPCARPGTSSFLCIFRASIAHTPG